MSHMTGKQVPKYHRQPFGYDVEHRQRRTAFMLGVHLILCAAQLTIHVFIIDTS
jgi:hypothetical protein